MPQYDPGEDFRLRMRETLSRFEPPRPAVPRGDPVDVAIDGVNNLLSKIAESPVGRAINTASDRLPQLREINIRTPFGWVRSPEIKLPELKPIALDERKREAVKNTVGIDVAQVAGVVPVVGDLVADVIEDTHAERLKSTLDGAEFDEYLRMDKFGPSVMAIARTFMHGNPCYGERGL